MRQTAIVSTSYQPCPRRAEAAWIRDDAHLDELIDRRYEDGGPLLYAARIDDQPGRGQTVRDPVLIRSSFMKGLGTSRGGALEG